jgi:riboflavin synthase
MHETGFDADVSGETLSVTTMRHVQGGSMVNLEPSLSIGERLGGHFVSGHVDCVGTILRREDEGSSVRLRIGVPAPYLRYIVKKGSVCVDGVSLTINDVSADTFEVNIIPHTSAATIAGQYAAGTQVNIEVDLIARYLEGLLAADANAAVEQKGTGITRDFLRAHGYA